MALEMSRGVLITSLTPKKLRMKGVVQVIDLPALNVQRGRDHGIADYNSLRAAVGLSKAKSFSDITSDTELANKLSELYGGDINNVDAFVGGLAEDKIRVDPPVSCSGRVI